MRYPHYHVRHNMTLFNRHLNRDIVLGKKAVAIGDLIVWEILRGFRTDKDYNTAKKYLQPVQQYNMLTPELALKGADNYRKLRKKDVTIRKTADIIIATFCIENKFPFFTPIETLSPSLNI